MFRKLLFVVDVRKLRVFFTQGHSSLRVDKN